MEYNVQITHKSIMSVDVLLEWESQPPTEPGWYWAYGDNETQMVNVDKDGIGDFLVAWNGEIPNKLTDYTHWVGPLPEPEMPL